MKEIILNIENPSPQYYMTDILKDFGYNGLLPANTIINKRRPSIGATHCELYAKRHSIIIEPFVTVIEVKKKKLGKKICAVMKKDFKIEDLVKYLNDTTIHYKKIVTTPESFGKVIQALKKHDKQYRQNYFLLIDECDKLIQFALFRKRIFAPMEEFFKFTNKAMVSATPPKAFSHPEFENQSFTYLDLKPTFDYKKNIKLVVTNNIRASLRNVVHQLNLKNDNKPVFLFTNCKRTILYFSRIDEVRDDFKIFCAENLSETFFKLNNTPNVENSVVDQSYARYNAFTSRFFSAVDIHPHNYAHIIIVTNVPYVAHSIIDPQTEAIQICGRDRLQAQSTVQQSTITHITNLYSNRLTSTEIETEKELYFIERLQDLAEKTPYPAVRGFIKSQIDKELLSQALKSDGSVDPFLKDNYDFNKSNKLLYHSKEALFNSYINSGYFDVTLKSVRYTFTDEQELKLVTAKGGIGNTKIYMQLLQTLLIKYDPFNTDQKELLVDFKKFEETNKLLFNAYAELGYDKISKMGFAKTKMKDAIFQIKRLQGDNAFLMIDRIRASFKLNIKYYVDDIKEKLQKIYNEFNYEKSPGVIHHAKATDIAKYFICKPDYRPKEKVDDIYKSNYRLIEPIDKISGDLAYMV